MSEAAAQRLVRRATEGDERAFAAIFRRYHQDLYRFCLAIVGNSQDAEDALQNTMVKVMRALPGEQREVQLKPWLYRIAHNEAIEMLRRRVPTGQLDSEAAAVAPGPAEEAEQRARLQRLLTDVGALPERQRGALVMRELADLDFDQIGAALGTSPAVARQTLYEARLSLRQMEEGRELSCDDVMRALSDADGRVTRRRDLRAHLRECRSCREFGEEMRKRRSEFAAIAPLPAVAAAGILQGIVGAAGGGGGAAAGAAGGAAAGKAVGASAIGGSVLAKSAVTVAVVAVIGVKVADRNGLVDVGLPGGDSKHVPVRVAPAIAPASPAVRLPAAPAAGRGENGGNAAAKQSRGAGGARSAPGGKAQPAAGGGADSPAAPGNSGAHRQDAGRHGNPPDASSHGQETSAGHKGGASAPGQAAKGAPPQGSGQATGATKGKADGPAVPSEPPTRSEKAAPPAPPPVVEEAPGKQVMPGQE